MGQVVMNYDCERTVLQMLGLTCVMGGIQIIWAVLMGSTSVSDTTTTQA